MCKSNEFFLYSFKIVLKRKLSKGNLSIKKKLFSFSKLQEIYRSLRLFTKIELFKNVQVFLLHFYLFCFILNEKKILFVNHFNFFSKKS